MPEEKNKQGGFNQEEIDALISGAKSGPNVPAGKSEDKGTAASETIYGGVISGEQIIRQADIDTLLEKAKTGGAAQAAASGSAGEKSFASDSEVPGDNLNLLLDVGLNTKIELGRTTITLQEILRLHEGAVIELDKLAGDPLDIIVNGRLIARGEVLVLNDNFCIRITDILSPEERLKATNIKNQMI